MKKILPLLLGGVVLLSSTADAQPTQPAPQLDEALLAANYRIVFDDEFNYADRQAFMNAPNPHTSVAGPYMPGPDLNKWHVDNSYVWKKPLGSDYSEVLPAEAWCNTKENVDIEVDPLIGKKVLVLRSTYFSTPLTPDTSQNLHTPSGTVIPKGDWDPTASSKPQYYRTTASVSPVYYPYYDSDGKPADGGYDNEETCLGWMNSFRYGIFQIRCKLPRRGGIQGAFWLFGGAKTCGSNFCSNDPDAGPEHGWEIDGFESFKYGYYGADNGDRIFYSTVQPNPVNGYSGLSTHNKFAFDPAADYHTYTIAWTPKGITWFVDGRETRTDDTSRGIPYSTMNAIISSHYLWNFGHGGTTNENAPPHLPDSIFHVHSGDNISPALINDRDETDFKVDWIKVWKPNVGSTQFPTNQTIGDWPPFKTALAWQKTQIADLGSNIVSSVASIYRNDFQLLYFTTPGTPSNLGVVGFSGSSWGTGLNLTRVRPGSGLAIDPNSVKLFYVGEDGHIWNRETNGNLSRLNWSSSMQANATNEHEELAYDGAPDVNDPAGKASNGTLIPRVRIYYTTGPNGIANGITGPNQLWYYEWTPSSGWNQYNTYIYNAAGPLTVVSGRVYYKGLDGNMWQYAYQPTPNGPTPGYWSSGNLNPANGSCYLADVDRIVGGVSFNSRPDGDRIFYLTGNKELKYYEYTTRYKQDVQVRSDCWVQGVSSNNKSQPVTSAQLRAEYLSKYEDETDVSREGYCASYGSLPHFRVKSTGQFVGLNNTISEVNGSVRHFNNQLLFVNGNGAIYEYRNFKRWHANRLAFAPNETWYTDLGPALTIVTATPASAPTAAIFGMDDNRLYTVDNDGKVWMYTTNELLNPVGNNQNYTRPVVPRPVLSTNADAVSSMQGLVTAYPNPTSVNITFHHPSANIVQVEVWDITGKRLQTVLAHTPSVTVATSELASGLYIYKVTDQSGKVSVGKFTK